MNRKGKISLTVLGLAFTLSSTLLTGCTTSNFTSSTKLTETTTSTSPITTKTTNLPYKAGLDISQSPKLDETAELNYNISFLVDDLLAIGKTKDSLKYAKAWLQFVWAETQGSYAEAKYGVEVPASKVILNGNPSWSGNAIEDNDIKLSTTIQFPEEGYWIIYGRFTGEGWAAPYESRMTLVVTKDAAGIVGTPGFNSGPLARFGDFSYGELARPSPSNDHPVTIELNISKPPRVGEEATITYYINSLNDVADFSTELSFNRRNGEKGPADKLIVKGTATSKLDLKAGVPALISATVIFPDADDWRIEVYGVSPKNISNKTAGVADEIELTITPDLGSYGWKAMYMVPSTQPTSGINTVTSPR
jgi:hypothetical protein